MECELLSTLESWGFYWTGSGFCVILAGVTDGFFKKDKMPPVFGLTYYLETGSEALTDLLGFMLLTDPPDIDLISSDICYWRVSAFNGAFG